MALTAVDFEKVTNATARRMGGAKRYPSCLIDGDGFRKGLNPSYELFVRCSVEATPKGRRNRRSSGLTGFRLYSIGTIPLVWIEA
jgi:hypothetical protein